MSHLTKTFLAAATFAFLFIATALPAQADTVVFNFTGTGNGTFNGGASGTFTGGANTTSPNTTQQFREIFNNSDRGSDPSNTTVTLTISGLTANANVTLGFNLYAINSLDGNDTSGFGDSFNITANGATIFNQTFANFPGATQTYNGTTNTGNNPAKSGAIATNTLGYAGPGNSGDATYLLSFTSVANSSGSITFTFNGVNLQPRADESFGLDNITVTAIGGQPSAVPEPTTMLLLGTGLMGVAAHVCRQRLTRKSIDA